MARQRSLAFTPYGVVTSTARCDATLAACIGMIRVVSTARSTVLPEERPRAAGPGECPAPRRGIAGIVPTTLMPSPTVTSSCESILRVRDSQNETSRTMAPPPLRRPSR